MEVTVAESAGFCFGVKRAVDLVYQEVKKGSRVFTLGPIIHNEQVVGDLRGKGVKVINSVEELEGKEDATVIIRSHGVTRAVYEALEALPVQIVDATCPFVKKIHTIVKEKKEEGYQIIIVGDPLHPEVEGIRGWCGDQCTVIETKEQAEHFFSDIKKMDRTPENTENKGFLPSQRYCIVAQTTYNYKKFKDIVDILRKKSYDISVMNTICNATEERQIEAGTIARRSDAMIVIGGKHSSNTQKLYDICKVECPNTYFIQTLDDLDLNLFQSFRSVGITAGASTPNHIIKEVQSYVREQ